MKSLSNFSFLILILLFVEVNAQPDFETQAQEISVMPSDTNQVLAWIGLSKKTMRKNYDLAQTYGDSALKLSENLEFSKGIILAKKQIGNSLYYRGKGDEAYVYWNEVYEYYKEIGEINKAASMLSNMGLIRRNQALYEEAMEAFFESLKIKESLNDSNGIASAYNNIAVTFAIQENFGSAKDYFFKALEVYESNQNEGRYNSLLLDIGGMYREEGKTDSSLIYIEKAVAYYSENGPDVQLARGLYILGNLYQDKEEYEQSHSSYDRSIELYAKLGDTHRKAGSILRKSETYKAQKDYSNAIAYAIMALEEVKETDSDNLKTRTYYLLYLIYKEQGDYENALKYKELNGEIKAEIDDRNNLKAIAELEEKYQTELRDRQLAELNAENKAKELKVEQQWKQQIALLALLVMLVVVAIALYGRASTKKKNNETLRAKNEIIEKALKDKEFLFREVHHRVKNNLQFISSLLNLQSRHIEDPKALGILNDARNRVKSMALVHQKLYQEENLSGVDMKNYMSNLVDSLAHSFKINEGKVKITLDVDPMSLDIDTAIPIGIIFNELITNSFKYAFDNTDSATLRVHLKQQKESIQLLVADNGPGVKTDKAEETFGTQLIESMVDKLKGSIQIGKADGHSVEIKIPNNAR
jgi:two-component sensor histidine kinase